MTAPASGPPHLRGDIWLNGEHVAGADARVHVLSYGLHYALAVFEGIRVYHGRGLFLDDHLERLRGSAERVGMEVRWSTAELADAVDATCRRGGVELGYVRPVLWRGPEDMAYAQKTSVNAAVAAWPWPDLFGRDAKIRGIALQTSSWARPAPHTLPHQAKCSASYLIGCMAKQAANAAGFDDALMLTYDGRVAEASGANLFIVRGGELLTPLPDCFLDGITRRAVLRLARQAGLEAREGDVTVEALREAEEVFLTGTAYEIQPVARIDDRVYEGRAVARRLMEAFEDVTHRVPRTLLEL